MSTGDWIMVALVPVILAVASVGAALITHSAKVFVSGVIISVVTYVSAGAIIQPTIAKPLTFGLMTDIHVVTPYNPAASVRFLAATSEFNANSSIQFVANCGDSIHDPADNATYYTDWALYQSYADNITKPIYPVMGNHDNIPGVNCDAQWTALTGKSIYYYVDLTDWRLLFLRYPGGVLSADDATQYAWIRNTVSSSTKPVLVFSHRTINTLSGVIGGEGDPTLAAWLYNSGKVMACFAGDVHYYSHNKIKNTHFISYNALRYDGNYPHGVITIDKANNLTVKAPVGTSSYS